MHTTTVLTFWLDHLLQYWIYIKHSSNVLTLHAVFCFVSPARAIVSPPHAAAASSDAAGKFWVANNSFMFHPIKTKLYCLIAWL